MAIPKLPESPVQLELGPANHAEQPLDGHSVGLESAPALGCLLPFVGVTGETALHLHQPFGQHPPPLDQPGGPHLESPACGSGGGDALVDAHPLGSRRLGLVSRGHPGRVEDGDLGLQVGYSGRVALDALVQLGVLAAGLLDLRRHARTLVGHPTKGVRAP